jgi:hypothetical protein
VAAPQSRPKPPGRTLELHPVKIQSRCLRLLGHFHNLNFTPRRVVAEFGVDHRLPVKVHVSGMSEARLSLITAKIGENPFVVTAYRHRL